VTWLALRLGAVALLMQGVADRAPPAVAEPRHTGKSKRSGPDDRSVTACSRHGNGCYTAVVRRGPLGPQMRLKGGTWIDCRGDCRETLREETVDFWDTQQERARAIR